MGDEKKRPGRPKVDERNRVYTGLRIPEDVHTALVEAARERGFSTNYLAVRAIEDFLARLIPVEELRLTRGPKEIEHG